LIQRLRNYLALLTTKLKVQSPSKADLIEEPATELISIGSILKKSRLEQNLTLKSISLKTFIPVDILQSIEEGKLDQLPELVYLKNTIKKYSEFLNVDLENSLKILSPNRQIQNTKSSIEIFKMPTLVIQPVHLYIFYILLVILSVHKIASLLEESTYPIQNTIEYKQNK